MPKLLDTSVPLPDPMTLVNGDVQVHEFIEEARQAIVANNNGTEPHASIYLKLFRARWRDIPVLGPLLNRLTAADANNIANLITSIENALYPNGQRDVHHRKIAQYNARIQRVVEHQGAFYPERVLAYMEDKRRLAAQIPDAQRPDEGRQIFDLAEGLHPSIKPWVINQGLPDTLEELHRRLLWSEHANRAPANAQLNTAMTNTITLPPVLPPVAMPHAVYMTHAYAGGAAAPSGQAGPSLSAPPPPPSLRGDLVAMSNTIQASLQDSISQLAAQINTVFTAGASSSNDRDDDEEHSPSFNRGRYDHYGRGRGGQGRGYQGRGGRGGPNRGGRRPYHTRNGAMQTNNRPYCPDCDIFGHDESDCWGECSVCHRRGHKSEACYQRKSTNKKRPAKGDLDLDDIVQKLGQHMASAKQQKKQRQEIDKRARDALRQLEDEDA